MSINHSQAIIQMLVIINYLWHSFPLIVTKFCFDAMVETPVFSQSSALSAVFTKPFRAVLCRQYWSTSRAKGWYHPPFLFQRRKKCLRETPQLPRPAMKPALFPCSGGGFKTAVQEKECPASGEESWLQPQPTSNFLGNPRPVTLVTAVSFSVNCEDWTRQRPPEFLPAPLPSMPGNMWC